MTAVDDLFTYVHTFEEVNRNHLLRLVDDAVREARQNSFHRGFSYAKSAAEDDEELLKEVD